MNKLKFAIVGCGNIARRHAEHIDRLATLAAVCDIVPEKADTLAAHHGAKSYHDLDDMLRNETDIDVVSVCTPNGLHAAHAIKAFRAGAHVLCEKPMALSAADCGQMIDTAEKCNRRLFVVKQNRFNPPVQALKQIIDEGRLGKVTSVQLNCYWNRNGQYYHSSDWKGSLDLDGGTLFTQFSHFIDIVFWLFGDIASTHAIMDNYSHNGVIEFEDSGVIAMRFANGIIGGMNYTVNSFETNMEGSLTVFGEKGTVKIGGQYLNELEYQRIDGYTIENLPAGQRANDYGQYQGSMSNHDKVYENVIDVLTRNGCIATNGYEGLKVVEIIEKIYRSAGNRSGERK